ncbi:MAG: hypothetical protein KDI44_19040 [Thiothrix sp.]|nr:hypothetical protein [Thiothrix sp.]
MSDIERITELLSATIEAMGQEISAAALVLMAEDLEPYGVPVVSKALARVRRESRRFTLADVIERIDDGRPGVEEAWAMMPKSEAESVVWTPEMRDAYFAALPLLEDGDKVGARMAFKERYSTLLAAARADNHPAVWEASLGHNPELRDTALAEAVGKKRLSASATQLLLPSTSCPLEPGGARLLKAASAVAALTGPTVDREFNASKAAELLKEHFDRPAYTKPKKAVHLIAVGTIRDGMRFIGGDPGNPLNWVDVRAEKQSLMGGGADWKQALRERLARIEQRRGAAQRALRDEINRQPGLSQ